MQLVISNGTVVTTHDDWQTGLAALYPGSTVVSWAGAPPQLVNPATGLPQTIPDPSSFVYALVQQYTQGGVASNAVPWTDWTVTATTSGPQIAAWNTAKLGAQPTNAAIATIASALTAAQITAAQCCLTSVRSTVRLASANDEVGQAVRAVARVLVPVLDTMIAYQNGVGNAITASGATLASIKTAVQALTQQQTFTIATALQKVLAAAQAETSPTS